jgi:hypothetical protein
MAEVEEVRVISVAGDGALAARGGLNSTRFYFSQISTRLIGWRLESHLFEITPRLLGLINVVATPLR